MSGPRRSSRAGVILGKLKVPPGLGTTLGTNPAWSGRPAPFTEPFLLDTPRRSILPRPVTPEAAGSSPVAPVSRTARKRRRGLARLARTSPPRRGPVVA